MEIRTVKIKTTHDLRPVIELLDQTEESVESIMLLIGIGAARSAEFAAREADGPYAASCERHYDSLRENMQRMGVHSWKRLI